MPEATKTRRRRSRRAATGDPAAEERERAVAEARAETERRIEESERLHTRARRKGASAAPHKQDPSRPVLVADHHLDEATVAVEVGHDPEHPADVGQEDLGMGPLKVKRAIGGGATQPPARSKSAWTLPTATKEDGKTALVFVNPGSGTALGTQQAKATGGQQVLAGGPGGSATVLADTRDAAGSLPALPVFSDRLATDGDVNAGQMVPSGASNLPRMRPVFAGEELGMKNERVAGKSTQPVVVEADRPAKGVVVVGADRPVLPERVESDRLARTDEEMTSVVTPEHSRERPHDNGQEALGMGPLEYLGGPSSQQPTTVVASDRHLAADEKPVQASAQSLASKQGKQQQARAARKAAPKAGRKRVRRSKASKPQVIEQKVEQKDAAKSGAAKAEVTEIPVAAPDTRPPEQANADARPPQEANAEPTHQE